MPPVTDHPYSVVYSTAPTEEAAQIIAQTLVSEKLVACANLLPGVTSVYQWEGAVQTDAEVVMIMKTRTELVDAVIERIKELHEYDIPCLTSWPITAGSPDYLNWIQNETER